MKSLCIILALAAVLTGCAGTQQTSSDTSGSDSDNKLDQVRLHLGQRSENITSLEFAGAIISKRGTSSQRGNFELAMYQTDSLLLSIYMPFGNVLVGALSASPSEFLYYDAFRSRAIEGVPSAENLERILFMPLSQEDVARLVRGEIPGGIAEFREYRDDKGLESLVRKREGYVERVLYSESEQAITQYARKNDSGETLVTVNYGEFKPVEGVPIASVVNMEFPAADMELTLRCDEILLNQPASSYNFDLPDGIQRSRY